MDKARWSVSEQLVGSSGTLERLQARIAAMRTALPGR
jgi:hypothetical protein